MPWLSCQAPHTRSLMVTGILITRSSVFVHVQCCKRAHCLRAISERLGAALLGLQTSEGGGVSFRGPRKSELWRQSARSPHALSRDTHLLAARIISSFRALSSRSLVARSSLQFALLFSFPFSAAAGAGAASDGAGAERRASRLKDLMSEVRADADEAADADSGARGGGGAGRGGPKRPAGGCERFTSAPALAKPGKQRNSHSAARPR
jgi:hypothetical protein